MLWCTRSRPSRRRTPRRSGASTPARIPLWLLDGDGRLGVRIRVGETANAHGVRVRRNRHVRLGPRDIECDSAHRHVACRPHTRDAWVAAPSLAGLAAASVQGRVALGRERGARVTRVGEVGEADGEERVPGAACQARANGLDLHAGRVVPAGDSARTRAVVGGVDAPHVGLDVLACGRCRGRPRLIALIEQALGRPAGPRFVLVDGMEAS
jgi:hypothetical protein